MGTDVSLCVAGATLHIPVDAVQVTCTRLGHMYRGKLQVTYTITFQNKQLRTPGKAQRCYGAVVTLLRVLFL